jgi:hypothetical protein
MAQLTFTKTNNQWVAEFEATADFNLHIERNDVGTLGIYQRGTASGNYAPVQGAVLQLGKTFDADFVGAIYPKYIKVVSASEVVNAEVNY